MRGIRFSHTDRLAPTFSQVIPQRVHGLDQRHFLFPPPLFDFRLAGDGVVHVAELLVIDKAGDVIPAGKSVSLAGFVLENPCGQEACHADVQNTALTGHDVDVEPFLSWPGQQIPPLRLRASSE